MTQSNILQEMQELRQLENLITEKTGYRTKINFTKSDEEDCKQYQIHVSADDKTWKFIDISFEDVDEAYYLFMFSLLHRPADFTSYYMGSYGLLLENALNAHNMGDLGYVISYGELVCRDMDEDEPEVVTLCKCCDIIKLSVETDSDRESKIVIIAKNKKITITDDGHKID